MFLLDRFIKGECPRVRRQRPELRRHCESVRRGVCPHRIDQSLLGPLFGAKPGAAHLRHSTSSSCQTPRCMEFLQNWTGETGPPATRGGSTRSKNGSASKAPTPKAPPAVLGDWDIRQRCTPTSASKFLTRPGKYFYVWLETPVGYLASLKNLLEKRGESLRRLHCPRGPAASSSTTSSARTLSPSTPSSGPPCCTSAAARRPTACSCTASSP